MERGYTEEVLDHGFVRLVDYYGSDKDIVDAARLSISGEGVQRVTEDMVLLRYLMRHRHTTPFEMADIKIHMKVPIFSARQIFRHRTFSYNELSGRYSELPEECYVPKSDDVAFQSKKNKQGREGKPSLGLVGKFLWVLRSVQEKLFEDYHIFLGKMNEEVTWLSPMEMDELSEHGGFAREIARINLPLATYTEFYMKGNLHNWLHFLSLRMDSHAQHEIRMFANVIGKIISELYPQTWQAFLDYRFEAITLTRQDAMAIGNWLRDHDMDLDLSGALEYGVHPTKREQSEFLDKLQKICKGE